MSAARLEVSGVTWAPARGAPLVLHDTSFVVEPGRVLGIAGPNGAGKSTLLRLLYRFQRPLSGHVTIGGRDLWQMSARDAAKEVAAVLQEQTSAVGVSVRDIVRLGRMPHRAGWSISGAHDEEVVDRVLDRLDLRGLEQREFSTLSGGERQRTMVARALAQEPQVLIMDEPTNHLDIRHQLEVVELIKTLGLTIVVSLHDLNLAAGSCDDVLVLKDGHPAGFGPPDEVLSNRLVSETFRVAAIREQLAPSGVDHFTFSLPS